MKKTIFLLVLIFFTLFTFARGILTNSNQSAQFLRLLSRGASTSMDAVYYNPAGLMKMNNGFYIAVHNQSLFQTRTINTSAQLNNQEFIGDVSTPLFPSAYAVYKKDDIAFSIGFGPNGGEGTTDYENGLPSFEQRIAGFVPMLSGLNVVGYDVSGYEADIQFNGQSIFWGLQLGVSAKINEVLSGYVGLRYLPSINAYEGSISNISLMVNDQLLLASPFLNNASGTIAETAALADVAANGLQSVIDGGGGGYTIQQIHQLGFISSAQRSQIEGGLRAAGLTPGQIQAMSISQAHDIYAQKASDLNGLASMLEGASGLTGDVEVNTKQTGTGITPVFGLNISPADNLNIGIKYEHKTRLELTNDSKKADLGYNFLKDGEKISDDIPGILSIGADYKFSSKISATATFINYFDKGVNWGINIYGQERTIDSNGWELALGLEYKITDNFAVSLGGMQSTTGVSEQYQSDFRYSNSSNTGALGFQWKISVDLLLDAGMMYTIHKDVEKSFGTHTETYGKTTTGFAIGLAYKIF